MKRTETFHLVSLIKNLHNSQSQNMFQTKVNISISLKNMGGGGHNEPDEPENLQPFTPSAAPPALSNSQFAVLPLTSRDG
jgi:hypothetical protein